MKVTGLLVLWLWLLGTSGEVIAASCSSYYISEIALVSPGDTQAGPVHTFVGFGASKEEAENMPTVSPRENVRFGSRS